jgi:hypothetical protein
MAINEHAPVTARSEIRIAAPPEIVWQLISRIAEWPSWNDEIKSAELDGPLAPGSRFRWRSGPGQIASTLRDVTVGEALEWTGTTFGIRAIHVWRIRPDAEGSVAVTEESWEGLPVRLLRGRSQKALETAIESGLRRLKAEAEQRAARQAR